MSDTCKGEMWGGWHMVGCSRKATRDGFCGTHHPDAVARRKAKSKAYRDAKYESQSKEYEAERQQRAAAERLPVVEAECATLRARLSTLEATLARVSEERDELLRAVGRLVYRLRCDGRSLDVFPVGDEDWTRAVELHGKYIARQSPPSTVGQPGDWAAGEGVG